MLLHAGIVPYHPLVLSRAPLEDASHAALKIAWWALAAWFVVGVVRVFFATEHRPHEGKLVQDLLAGLIYLAAFFAIISYVFDLPIEGLLATSGAIAIIVGLALQSTLSDVFSGPGAGDPLRVVQRGSGAAARGRGPKYLVKCRGR